MQRQQATYELELMEHNKRITTQRDILKGLGQGTIRMKGSPNDTISRELWNLWEQGRWGELMKRGSYKSTEGFSTFSLTVDSNLTPAQKQGIANLEQYIREADTLKEAHLKIMQELDSDHNQLRDTMFIYEKDRVKAEQQLTDADSENEPNWELFASKYPVQYSEIKMLHTINKHVSKVAEWMFQVNTTTGPLKALVSKLESLTSRSECDPGEALVLVKNIQDILKRPTACPLAFLTAIGGRDLRRQMRPLIRDTQKAPLQALADFEKDQHPIEVD